MDTPLPRQDAVTLDADATLMQAARLMHDRHAGTVVVTRHAGPGSTHLVGIVTDRDLALQTLVDGHGANTRIGDLAGGRVVSLPGSATPLEAAAAMHAAGVHRLLLVDDAHRLTGLVTMEDLALVLAGHAVGTAAAPRRAASPPGARAVAGVREDALLPVAVPPELAWFWRRTIEP